VKAIWDLLRLEHGFMYGVAVIIGMIVSSECLDVHNAIFGFLTALFCQASAFALNDYIDYEVDLRNRRMDRPLVRGELSRRSALIISIALAPFGFVFAYLISIQALAFVLMVSILSYIYNVKLKEFGLIGNAYIAFTMCSPFLFGGIVAGGINVQIAVLSILAFLSGLGREIMKGIEDVEGDALRNVRSVARSDIRFAYKLSAFLIASSVSLSFLPIFHYGLDPFYILPVFLADVLFIKTISDLLSFEENISKLRRITLLAMGFGLAGFLLGAIL